MGQTLPIATNEQSLQIFTSSKKKFVQITSRIGVITLIDFH